jgi:ABC-type cobalamin/Fe3+-siderophores transport system ATPase subunit
VLVAHDLSLGLAWATHGLLLKGGNTVALGPLSHVLTETHLEALYPGARVRVDQSMGRPQVLFQK